MQAVGPFISLLKSLLSPPRVAGWGSQVESHLTKQLGETPVYPPHSCSKGTAEQ